MQSSTCQRHVPLESLDTWKWNGETETQWGDQNYGPLLVPELEYKE